MHHIQKSILDCLSTATDRRYSDLKPHDLDGNVFNYHLKQLLAGKLVNKSLDGNYTLASAGVDYIVHRYENPLLQAHSIFLIAIRRGDKWLMRERLVQPLLGMSGFIHGEPVAGEPLVTTAMRRLQEKTGLTIPLAVRCGGLITILRDNAIESFSHAIILTGSTDQDVSVADDKTGRNYWLAASSLSEPMILPSCADIIAYVDTDATTTFELTYHIK